MLVPSDSRKSNLGTAAARAHQNLVNNREGNVYQYLTEERGLTDQTVAQFMLGEVPANDPDYGDKAGWVTIPYITVNGIVDLRFRRPPDSGHPAKYQSLPGSELRIFNPTAILTALDTVVVAEGEMDCMILAQAGFHTIGLPGASSWQSYYGLALQGMENVIVCEDGDDKGAGARLSARILADLDNARVVRFDDGDVNSFFLQHGRQALVDKVSAAVGRSEEKGGQA